MPDGRLVTGRSLSRRAVLLAPLALGGCGVFDDWFGTKKTPLPGTRESILAPQRGLTVDQGVPPVTLPPAVHNAAWPQIGGNPVHDMGHLAINDQLSEAWRSGIGSGGGYRAVIMAQPVVQDGIAYAMDSDAVVSAFRLADGSRVWRFDTRREDVDSTNVGGGLAVADGTLYATNGVGDLVAVDAAKGTLRWRTDIGEPARSGPTVVEGRIFLTTMEDRLLAHAAADGHFLWSHVSNDAVTQMLGQGTPAVSQGLVVAGFGSGELAAVRADSGTVAWTDGLSAGHGGSLADFQSVRGAPVIAQGRVFAISMGGLLVAIDLPTGRRLWERQVTGENMPWLAGDWLFVLSIDQQLAAINALDGRVAWLTALPRWDDPEKQKDSLTWYGPTLAGDRLIVGGSNDQLLSVSPYTGAILGRQALSNSAAPFAPVVADGTVLVVSDGGRLIALR
jgi:outer membrane protein assembly factor BamB